MRRALLTSLLTALFSGTLLHAQVGPSVRMSVTLPDGTVKELVARESGLAELSLPDGTSIGLRPTILDSKPWNRVVVTFFKMPTATHAAEEIEAVETKTGGAAVQMKERPALKV